MNKSFFRSPFSYMAGLAIAIVGAFASIEYGLPALTHMFADSAWASPLLFLGGAVLMAGVALLARLCVAAWHQRWHLSLRKLYFILQERLSQLVATAIRQHKVLMAHVKSSRWCPAL